MHAALVNCPVIHRLILGVLLDLVGSTAETDILETLDIEVVEGLDFAGRVPVECGKQVADDAVEEFLRGLRAFNLKEIEDVVETDESAEQSDDGAYGADRAGAGAAEHILENLCDAGVVRSGIAVLIRGADEFAARDEVVEELTEAAEEPVVETELIDLAAGVFGVDERRRESDGEILFLGVDIVRGIVGGVAAADEPRTGLQFDITGADRNLQRAVRLIVGAEAKTAEHGDQAFQQTGKVGAERTAEGVEHGLEFAGSQGEVGRAFGLFGPDVFLVGGGVAVGVVVLSGFACALDNLFVGGNRCALSRIGQRVGDRRHLLLGVVVLLENRKRDIDAVHIAVGEQTVGIVGSVAVDAVTHLRGRALAVPQLVGGATVILGVDDAVDDELPVRVRRDFHEIVVPVVVDIGEIGLACRVVEQRTVGDGCVGGVSRRAALGAAVHSYVVGAQHILNRGDELVVVAFVLAARGPAAAGACVEPAFLVCIGSVFDAFGCLGLKLFEVDGHCDIHCDDGNKHDHESDSRHDESAGAPVLDGCDGDDVDDCDEQPHSRRDPQAV